MSNLNQCNFIGRVGKEIEPRYTPDGKSVVNFSLAVSEQWKDKQGAKQERTEWINITAFDKLAEIIAQYVGKGDLLYISGKMVTRKWQDQSGADRYSTEIRASQMQMLGSKGDNSGQQRQAPQQQSNQQQRPQQQNQGYQNQSNPTYQQQGQAPQQGQPAPMAEPDFDFDDDIPW